MKIFNFSSLANKNYFVVYFNEGLIIEVINNTAYLSIKLNNKDLLLRTDRIGPKLVWCNLFKEFMLNETNNDIHFGKNLSRLEFLEAIQRQMLEKTKMKVFDII